MLYAWATDLEEGEAGTCWFRAVVDRPREVIRAASFSVGQCWFRRDLGSKRGFLIFY